MNKLFALALIGAPLLAATAAHATPTPTIYIGLQQAGVNGGAVKQEASSTNGQAGFLGSYGTFNFSTITAQGYPALPQASLDTTSIQTSSSSAGSINVFITETGLSSPLGISSFLSSFTSQLFNGAAVSVVESTFVSATNQLWGGTQLASQSFNGIGTAMSSNNSPSLGSPYSETVEYTITVGSGYSNVNDTVNMSASPVPEPASLALLGAGLAAVGLIRRRRSAKV